MSQRRRPAALFDFDGTLCDTRHLRYLVASRPKRHEEFYARTGECPPNYEVVRAAHTQALLERAVLVGMGRMLKHSPVTLLALNRFGVPWADCFFRDNGDYRPAAEVKPELVERMRAAGYDPLWAWEDDPVAAAALEALGIEVTLVPGWNDPVTYPADPAAVAR